MANANPGQAGGAQAAGERRFQMKSLPIIDSKITPAVWNAHLGRVNLTFAVEGLTDIPANSEMRRVLLYLSLGNEGAQKAYHMSPEQRPPDETYAAYVAALSQIFVPRQESDMAKLDYRRCKQGKTEAIQTFHARKVRLFMDAFRVEPANMAARMEQFTDDYIESIVRREVKLELLQNKPYATPEAVLTRAMSSCATHRALVPEGAPASAFDGLHSTNHYGATTTAAAKAGVAAGGVEPMEIGMFDAEEEDDMEATLASLSYEETPAEKDVWEDPATQTVLMVINNKETRACFTCQKIGHLKRDCWRRPKNQSIAARNRVRQQSGNRGMGAARRGTRAGPFQGRQGQPSSTYQKTADLVSNAGWRGQNGSTGSGDTRSSYLNALYDIQANGLSYEGEQASTQENQTPAAAARTSTVTSGGNNFGANF